MILNNLPTSFFITLILLFTTAYPVIVKDSNEQVYTPFPLELENNSKFTIHVELGQFINGKLAKTKGTLVQPNESLYVPYPTIDNTKPIYIFISSGASPILSWTIQSKGKTVYIQLIGAQFNSLHIKPITDSRYFSGMRWGAGYTKSNLSLEKNLSESDITKGVPQEISIQPVVIQEAKTVSGPKPQEHKPQSTSIPVLSAKTVKVTEVIPVKSQQVTPVHHLRSEVGPMATMSIPWRFELSNKSGVPLIVKILDDNKRLIFQTQDALKPSQKVRIADIVDTNRLYLLLRQPGTIGKHDVVKSIKIDAKKKIFLTVEKGAKGWIVRPQKGGGIFGTEGYTESGIHIGYNVTAEDIFNFDESKL